MARLERIHWNGRQAEAISFDSPSETVNLNLRGCKFEVYIELLDKFPDTPLCEIANYSRNYGKQSIEFFMDRNPVCFGAILDYLTTGNLHYPSSVCGALFRSELMYWGIEERLMQKCCMNDYMRAIEIESKLRCFTTYIKESEARPETNHGATALSRCRSWLWNVMTLPTYSREATIYCIITSILLTINVSVIIVQSVYVRRVADLDFATVDDNVTLKCRNFAIILSDDTLVTLFHIDAAFSLLFTLEIITRCLCAPSLRAGLTCLITYIELLSLLPFFLTVYVLAAVEDGCPTVSIQVIRTLFTLRIIRIFRLFVVLRFYCVFRAFVYTLKSSFREILVLFTLVALTTIVMGTLTTLLEYAYLEYDKNNAFNNILTGFWWAIITATTVGYGDVVPESPLGRLMTVIVALSGILVIALATPMVSANFDVINRFISGQSVLERTRDSWDDIGSVKSANLTDEAKPMLVQNFENVGRQEKA